MARNLCSGGEKGRALLRAGIKDEDGTCLISPRQILSDLGTIQREQR